MRPLFLSIALVLAPCVVAPRVAPVAHAQSRAQRDALRQWAKIIRRCRTAPVMWQVYGVLGETIEKVEAVGDIKNAIFTGCLKQMQTATRLKAQGIEQRSPALLNAAETTIQNSLRAAGA